jgi:ribonuclease T2
MRIRVSLLLAAVAGAAFALACAAKTHGSSHSRSHGHKPAASGTRGEYDYYVMALSWSPTYCELHPDEDEQCGHKGYGFVLHGLWPQYENGGGPEECATSDAPGRRTIARTLAFMPSRALINHEWRAHGACSGLDADAYFALADQAFGTIHAPPELGAPQTSRRMTQAALRDAFRRANPGLADDMLSLHCSRGQLVEVRVCLGKDLAPRECGERMTSRCPSRATFTVPASR